MSDQQMHVNEEERAHHMAHLEALKDCPAAIIDQQTESGYSLATLREVAEHLAWHTFTEGELNQINRLAEIVTATVRARHRDRRAAEKAKRLTETPVQTSMDVYPKDSQGRSRYYGD